MVSESPNRLSEDWGGRLFGQTYLNQDFPGGASIEIYIHYISIFYMSCNILDPLFDKSEDLRHLEES